MQIQSIEAVVYYRHSPNEIARLEQATIPLHDAIRAVASQAERTALRRITSCKYFRLYQAQATQTMLLRAAKYARAHLDDYFPWMQVELISGAELLEEAVADYGSRFDSLRQTTDVNA